MRGAVGRAFLLQWQHILWILRIPDPKDKHNDEKLHAGLRWWGRPQLQAATDAAGCSGILVNSFCLHRTKLFKQCGTGQQKQMDQRVGNVASVPFLSC
jgi:hypothetical protein